MSTMQLGGSLFANVAINKVDYGLAWSGAPGSAAQFARMLPGAPFGERELVFAGGLGE